MLLLIPMYIAVSKLAFRNMLNMSPQTDRNGHCQNLLMCGKNSILTATLGINLLDYIVESFGFYKTGACLVPTVYTLGNVHKNENGRTFISAVEMSA